MQQELQAWRDVQGYEGLYQVSNDGRVRRLIKLLDSAHFEGVRKPLHELKQGSNGQGRKQVVLCKDGITKRFQVHRLVLIAFRSDPPFEGAECRHMDGNHLNNHIDNLEWGTHGDNMRDKTRHGTQNCGNTCGQSKLDENAVREIRASTMAGRALAEMYGVSQVAIHFIKTRKTWKHVI